MIKLLLQCVVRKSPLIQPLLAAWKVLKFYFQVSFDSSPFTEESTAETSISSTSLKRKRGNLQEAPESLREPDAKKTKLVEQLEKLSEDLNVEVLRSVSPQQLFKAHSHINSLMDSIMGVLKSKYQSSPSTS